MQASSILAVETSTVACSVTLIRSGEVFERYELLPQKHAHRLLEMVDEVMLEAGMQGVDLDLLAFGEGPGAFTGVRIAAGVIQGLALGWDKPVVGVSSLESMAQRVISDSFDSLPEQGEIPWCALMDARMSEVYLLSGSFNKSTKEWLLSEAELLSPEQALERIHTLPKGSIGLGDVIKEYPDLVALFDTWLETLPSATAIARIALRTAQKAEIVEAQVPLPVYLRNHVADTIEERKLKQAKVS